MYTLPEILSPLVSRNAAKCVYMYSMLSIKQKNDSCKRRYDLLPTFCFLAFMCTVSDVCVCVCVFICVHVCACLLDCVRACVCVCLCECVRACVRACECVICVCVCVCACVVA